MPFTSLQPQPVHNDDDQPAVFDLVYTDLQERDEFGKIKYNDRLKPHNGRDPLIDLYQELLDALVYIRSELYERYGA